MFHDREKLAYLRRLAAARASSSTDPDGAGFVIRNHLKGVLPPSRSCRPMCRTYGKGAPNAKGGKGKLGVEGMPPPCCWKPCAAAVPLGGEEEAPAAPLQLTKADLLEKGTDRPRLRRPAAGAVQETESAGRMTPQRPFAGAEHAADGGGVGGAR